MCTDTTGGLHVFIFFTSPEAINHFSDFRKALAKELKHLVSFVAIDEAHCVRQWTKISDKLTRNLDLFIYFVPQCLLWLFLQLCLLPLNFLCHVILDSENHTLQYLNLLIVKTFYTLSERNKVYILICILLYHVLIQLTVQKLSPKL